MAQAMNEQAKKYIDISDNSDNDEQAEENQMEDVQQDQKRMDPVHGADSAPEFIDNQSAITNTPMPNFVELMRLPTRVSKTQVRKGKVILREKIENLSIVVSMIHGKKQVSFRRDDSSVSNPGMCTDNLNNNKTFLKMY